MLRWPDWLQKMAEEWEIPNTTYRKFIGSDETWNRQAWMRLGEETVVLSPHGGRLRVWPVWPLTVWQPPLWRPLFGAARLSWRFCLMAAAADGWRVAAGEIGKIAVPHEGGTDYPVYVGPDSLRWMEYCAGVLSSEEWVAQMRRALGSTSLWLTVVPFVEEAAFFEQAGYIPLLAERWAREFLWQKVLIPQRAGPGRWVALEETPRSWRRFVIWWTGRQGFVRPFENCKIREVEGEA